MIKFIGQYNVKVDDKGRVIFPAAFKSIMPADGDMRFVVRKDIYEPCLEMYTWEEWERQSEFVRSKLNLTFNEQHAKFWRAYMYNCAIVEPDAKLGRISIPKKLLEMIGVSKEVTFSGSDHKIEIWARENLESSINPAEELKSLAEMLSDL